MKRWRAPLALWHMAEAAERLTALFAKHTDKEIAADVILTAAIERFVEIISEASRRIEPSWRAASAHIPWQNIADIGNVLRHAYDDIRIEVLLDLRGRRLDDLHRVIQALTPRS